MQSKEFISIAKDSFRQLRKDRGKLKNDLVEESGISWATLHGALKDMLECKVLKELPDKTLIINPNYQYFAGVYISKDSIDLSIIDFKGTEQYFESKKVKNGMWAYAFVETLKNEWLSKVKAIAICSDTYLESSDSYRLNDFLWINDTFTRKYVPNNIEIFYGGTCETNSWKGYDHFNLQDDKLNVIFSFYEQNCYYTIMKNGFIIQKRRYHTGIIKDAEWFFKNIIIPVCNAINPDNMIFMTTSEEISKFIKENILKWQEESVMYYWSTNQSFELRGPTNMIANEQAHPSEAAALYAMYGYYGWAK